MINRNEKSQIIYSLFHFILTMEIIKNIKGGSKLCFEDYTYTKKSAFKPTIHCECSKRKAYVCKGKVTTYSHVARVIRTVKHSHDANLERVEATKIIASMKESAGTRRVQDGYKAGTICVRHGTEDSVVLPEHHTLLYGKP